MDDKRQPVRFEDLKDDDQKRLRLRVAHFLEAESGFRSGSWHWAQEDEPRPEYDPERTTLTERRLAKVAELKALHPDRRPPAWSGTGQRAHAAAVVCRLA
ncbi:hypothetical protein ABZ743_31270 [Streptomyces sp. NPDC006662]|uniref:hypothetical protein n=1 Tax=Streptomyces sp. NPDC006662 TaxID=3156902 RepID=UPI0033F635CE